MDFDSTQTTRIRLIAVSKSLFAEAGYEQTSTASIARAAATSESQLVRHFGGKAGLLTAIFDESWGALREHVQPILASAPTAREALLAIFDLMIDLFSRDPDLAMIFLFEGRRIRGGDHEVFLSKGFVAFQDLLVQLIERGQRDGSFRSGPKPGAICSALLGAAEGMIRDRLMEMRNGKPAPYETVDVRSIFRAVVAGLA